MISGKAQRELQKQIDLALADETITYRVEKLIESATLEYNKLLETKPEICDSGLVGHIYGKLLAKGFIIQDEPKEEDE